MLMETSDLVVAFNGSGLRWWENNDIGQFGEMTPENFRSRTGPTSLAVADVDQNGLLDLYVANYGENTIRSGASVRTRMVRVSKSSPEDGGTALKSSMASWWSLGNPITSGYSLPKARLFNCHGPKGVFWMPAGDL